MSLAGFFPVDGVQIGRLGWGPFCERFAEFVDQQPIRLRVVIVFIYGANGSRLVDDAAPRTFVLLVAGAAVIATVYP